MTAPQFNVGDIVRVKTTGAQATIESINPNPDYAAEEESWAEASSSTGFNDVDIWSPDDVELVMDAEKAAARAVPSEADIATFVAAALHSASEKLAVFETVVNGSDIEVAAHTGDGLTIEFTITVGQIMQVRP